MSFRANQVSSHLRQVQVESDLRQFQNESQGFFKARSSQVSSLSEQVSSPMGQVHVKHKACQRKSQVRCQAMRDKSKSSLKGFEKIPQRFSNLSE